MYIWSPKRGKANRRCQRPNSMLTFESAQVLGQDLITEKLVVYGFPTQRYLLTIS